MAPPSNIQPMALDFCFGDCTSSRDWLILSAQAVAAVSTLGLLALAFAQLRGIRHDARARHKPLLSMQRAFIREDGRIRVWLQNTGFGPASNIRFRVWLKSGTEWLSGQDLTSDGEAFWAGVDKSRPDFEHILGSIGADQSDVMVYLGRVPEVVDRGGIALLVYDFEHDDIYGNRLPSVKPAERKPGYANVLPEWHPEMVEGVMPPLSPDVDEAADGK